MDPYGGHHQPQYFWPAQQQPMPMSAPWVMAPSGFWDPNVPPPPPCVPSTPTLTTPMDASNYGSQPQWNIPYGYPSVDNAGFQYGRHSGGSYDSRSQQAATTNFRMKQMETEDETTDAAISQRRSDQTFVDTFFTARVKYSEKKPQNSALHIADVRVAVKRCLRHIDELKAIHATLKGAVHDEDSAWDSISQRALFLQRQTKASLDQISSPEQLRNLKAKLKKIRKKRDRLRRQKLHRIEAKIEREKRSKMVHEKLDSWLQSVRQKYLDQQMEKKMKKEADSILSEVRRKKAEAMRTLALVKSVEKLRVAKKRSSEAKGLFSTSESDSCFADAVARFESTLSARLVEYGEEERTLQAMLDEERRETRDAEEKRRLREHDDRVSIVKCDITTSLFGNEAVIDERDPRFYFWESYTRAERNLEALIHVRHDWDVWLVRTDTDTSSSSVPVGWVKPSEPSSEAWASVLDKRQ